MPCMSFLCLCLNVCEAKVTLSANLVKLEGQRTWLMSTIHFFAVSQPGCRFFVICWLPASNPTYNRLNLQSFGRVTPLNIPPLF